MESKKIFDTRDKSQIKESLNKYHDGNILLSLYETPNYWNQKNYNLTTKRIKSRGIKC